MARIAGIDLPREKKIQYALPYIFGIGPSNARKILSETGVNPDARVRDLRDAEVARLRQVIERDYKVEGALRTEVAMNIKRLMDIGTYRGVRHRKRSEEHTSELQSLAYLVCRLLLEKKKNTNLGSIHDMYRPSTHSNTQSACGHLER